MKILLLGGTGMLGYDCKEVLARYHEVIAPSREELDIVSWDRVIEVFQETAPDIVINCAAFTDVDACETEDFVRQKVNVEGPRNLAQGCARFECKFVHISSDYVFDGAKNIPQPYFEHDVVNPISAYGKCKNESEKAVRENSPNYIILRCAWLYGINGKNFVRSILRQALKKPSKPIRVANDQFGSPTWTYRVAQQINTLLAHDSRGTYHSTAEGFCSRLEYAEYILKNLGIKATVKPCKMEDLNAAAKRPSNCILENRLLKKKKVNVMLDWKEDLNTFLDQFGETLIKEAKAGKS